MKTKVIEVKKFGRDENVLLIALETLCGVTEENRFDVIKNLRQEIPQRFTVTKHTVVSFAMYVEKMCPDVEYEVLDMVCIRITAWGSNRLCCVKALKELLPDLTLKQAKDTVWEHELPLDVHVLNDERFKEFTDFTQKNCDGMQYIIVKEEDSVEEKEAPKDEAEPTQIDDAFIKNMYGALWDARKFFDIILKRYLDEQKEKEELTTRLKVLEERYIAVRAEANMLEAKVKDLTRQNEKLTDHLKRAREGKKVLGSKLKDFQIANRELNEFIEKQTEFIKAVEDFSQQLNKLNSKSIKDGSTN